jgi:hypothetical protein
MAEAKKYEFVIGKGKTYHAVVGGEAVTLTEGQSFFTDDPARLVDQKDVFDKDSYNEAMSDFSGTEIDDGDDTPAEPVSDKPSAAPVPAKEADVAAVKTPAAEAPLEKADAAPAKV